MKIVTVETPKPTAVLVQQNNYVKVTSRLYGEVTVARMNQEQQILRHRVDQLSPIPDVKPVKPVDEFDDFEEFDEAEFDN